MQANVPRLWRNLVAAVIAAVAIGISASEAYASSSVLTQADCSLINWCSGGQGNCDACCGPLGGLCYSANPNIQGCLCR